MAEQKLGTLFGDSLVTLLEWAWPRIEPKVEAAFDFVSDALRPEPQMNIRTFGGDTMTGVLVVERGRVFMFLGTRHRATAASSISHERFAEEPLWPRGEPYSTR